MRGLLKMTVSAVAHTFGHVSYRCLSGRPPAPLGGRILTNPKDIFHHNMWYFCVVILHQMKFHFVIVAELEDKECLLKCRFNQLYSYLNLVSKTKALMYWTRACLCCCAAGIMFSGHQRRWKQPDKKQKRTPENRFH